LEVGLAGAALLRTPRGDRVATTGGLALTTTVRVVDGVHGDTAHGRPDALPAHAAGLAPVDVGLLCVADLAYGGAAACIHVADFTRRQTELRVRTILRDETDRGAGGAGHLGAAARLQLDG